MFWAHLIEDQEGCNRHADYIHWNPAKHGHTKNVIDWPYSSFHRYLRQGIYTIDWGNDEKYDIRVLNDANDAPSGVGTSYQLG
jgi:putative transposase